MIQNQDERELLEKYQELLNRYTEEKALNDELIEKIKKITKNSNEISEDYIKTKIELSELKQHQNHGARVELENGYCFIPFLEKNMIKMKNIKNKPLKIQYTFTPEKVLEWFHDLEETLLENKPN